MKFLSTYIGFMMTESFHSSRNKNHTKLMNCINTCRHILITHTMQTATISKDKSLGINIYICRTGITHTLPTNSFMKDFESIWMEKKTQVRNGEHQGFGPTPSDRTWMNQLSSCDSLSYQKKKKRLTMPAWKCDYKSIKKLSLLLVLMNVKGSMMWTCFSCYFRVFSEAPKLKTMNDE